ncbi:helix-turn-helix domain-containing protein [Acidiphilium sp.]|uniref:helix-turn-helix domain-containing protein n=1 Tax=Acidiphilium sp. TaxID=527 RepID=UPI003D074968
MNAIGLNSPSSKVSSRRLLAVREVADLFGRSPRTVRGWIADGRLPVLRIGRTPFVPESALDRMIAAAIAEPADSDEGPKSVEDFCDPESGKNNG